MLGESVNKRVKNKELNVIRGDRYGVTRRVFCRKSTSLKILGQGHFRLKLFWFVRKNNWLLTREKF